MGQRGSKKRRRGRKKGRRTGEVTMTDCKLSTFSTHSQTFYRVSGSMDWAIRLPSFVFGFFAAPLVKPVAELQGIYGGFCAIVHTPAPDISFCSHHCGMSLDTGLMKRLTSPETWSKCMGRVSDILPSP